MKVSITLAWIAITFIHQTGDPGAEELIKGTLKAIGDSTDVLKTVRDKKSAADAVPLLKEPLERMLTYGQKQKKLLSSGDLIFAKKLKEYERTWKVTTDQFTAEANRVLSQPELANELNKSQAWMKYLSEMELAKIEVAKVQVRWLDMAVTAYYAKRRIYPEGLLILSMPHVLDNSPALIPESMLFDPWNQVFMYDHGQIDPLTRRPLIYSQGSDPKDKKGRISNWIPADKSNKTDKASLDKKLGKPTLDAEKVLREMLTALSGATDALKSIQGKDAAETATPKIEDAAKKLRVAFDQIKGAGPKHTALAQAEMKLAQELDDGFTAFDVELVRLMEQGSIVPSILDFSIWDLRLNHPVWSRYLFQRFSHRARMNLTSIENAVIAYKNKNGSLPKSLFALTERQADGSEALLKLSMLTDPWGNPYYYEPKNLHPLTGIPLIYSHGSSYDPTAIRNWDPPEPGKK